MSKRTKQPDRRFASIANTNDVKGNRGKKKRKANGRMPEELPPIPDGEPLPVQRSAIVGVDNRERANERTFPHSCICKLIITDQDGRRFLGTGFLVSKRCVITAGHCVYFRDNWARQIKVIPGATNATEPFGAVVSTSFRTVSGWKDQGNDNFDYGAVLLPDDTLFRNVNAVMNYGESSTEVKVALAGYPLDKDGSQWMSAGRIVARSKFSVSYDLDTESGNSGSPIYTAEGGNASVVAVHNVGSNPNRGVRISAEVIKIWKEWSSQ